MNFKVFQVFGSLLFVLGADVGLVAIPTLIDPIGRLCESSLRSSEVNIVETTGRRSRLQGRASLFCYTCNSIKDGDTCYNVDNSTTPLVKCSNDKEAFCKVRRVEYTQTDVNEVFNASNLEAPNRWSMERGCSNECSNFCVNVGARTKITYCTSCCNTDGCNVDNAAPDGKAISLTMILMSWIFHRFNT